MILVIIPVEFEFVDNGVDSVAGLTVLWRLHLGRRVNQALLEKTAVTFQRGRQI